MTDQQIATHIFVSHSSADAAFVQRLAADLQRVGVPIWVDHQKLKAGTRNWEKAIREALKKSRALIYVASATARESDYVQDELSIAEMEKCTLLVAWAMGEDDRFLDCIPLGYGKLQYTDMRDEKYEDGLKKLLDALTTVPTRVIPLIPAVERDEAHAGPILEPSEPSTPTAPIQTGEVTTPRNPYKALDAFTEADAQDFFGRDDLIAALRKRLTDFQTFLTVIGASGSGKSSVVMAGLIPALRKDHPDWIILPPVKPGTHPVETLAIMLRNAYFLQASIKTIREDLDASNSRGLIVQAASIPRPAKARVVLLVDQFEEAFTQTSSEQEREQFINILTSAATDPSSMVTVILTLRADFFDRPLSDSELGKLIREHSEPMLPMSITDLKQTIEKPAERAGLIFDDGLVSDMVFDTRGQVGGLPLLQYTLEQLFEQRDGVHLTHQAYQAMGGVKGALARRAEETYTTLASDEYRRLTRALFLRLIEPGATEQDSTRRRAALSELDLPDPEQTKIIQACADTFVNTRLLTTNEMAGKTTIEVSHEALIREWKRLSEWLQNARDDVGLQIQIAQDAATWKQRGKKPGDDGLYRGLVLINAQDWVERNAPSAIEKAFVDASSNAQTKRLQALRRIQRATVISTLVFVIIIGLTALSAINAQNQAKNAETQVAIAGMTVQAGNTQIATAQTQVAVVNSTLTPIPPTLTMVAQQVQDGQNLSRSLQFSAQANKILQENSDPRLAVLLSIRGLRSAYSPQTDMTLMQALDQNEKLSFFAGHTGVVNSVAFSPDGRYVITGSDDKTVELWNVVTGDPIRIFTGHTAGVKNVAFSPDGRYVVSGSLDTTARLWETATGNLVRTLTGHTGAVNGVAFSPDGRSILTGSADMTARLWDVTTGNLIRTLTGHTAALWSVEFSPNGRYILTSSDDMTAQSWETATGQLVHTFTGHSDTVYGAAFSPDERYIVTGSADATARLWDAVTGNVVRTLTGHTAGVNDVAFSPDGRYILTGSDDTTARLWDTATGSLVHTMTGHTDAIEQVAFSLDGRYILTGSDDKTARLWDAATGKTILIFTGHTAGAGAVAANTAPHTFIGHTGTVNAVAFSPDDRYVATGSADTSTRLWEIATGKTIRTLTGHTAGVYGVEFSPDGRYVLTGSIDSTARLWDVATGKTIRILTGHTASVNAVAFSPDGHYILTGSSDNTARLWDAATGKTIRTMSGQPAGVDAVAFSPDGRYILTGSEDNTAQMWDAATGNVIHTLSGHTGPVYGVTFSPDGAYVLTGSADATARLWETTSGNLVRTFIGHTGTVYGVAFSPNGAYVLTGSTDTTARLWEVTSGNLVRTFIGHTAAVSRVTFSPDGRYVLAGSTDTTARLWDTDYRDFIAFACTQVRSDFTDYERREFGIDNEPTCPQFDSNYSMKTSMPLTPISSITLPIWTPIASPTPSKTFTPTVNDGTR